MKKIYNESNELTGYSFDDGFFTEIYDTSWELTGTELNTEADWSDIALNDDGTTNYTYTDDFGDAYTYTLDADNAMTGYSVDYSYSDYTYNYDDSGTLLTFEGSDDVQTTVYNADGTVKSTSANAAAFADLTAVEDDANGNKGYRTAADNNGAYTIYYVDSDENIAGYTEVMTFTYGDETWTYKDSYSDEGTFTGSVVSDGSTNWEYDADWELVSATTDVTGLDAVTETDAAPTGSAYKSTNDYGETTYYDADGEVTGYEYSWTSEWDNWTYVSSYDADWNFLGSTTYDDTDAVVWSETMSYENGVFTGSTYTDGSTTYTYDADWNLVSTVTDTSGMDVWNDADGNQIGYRDTNEWGDTTLFDMDSNIAGYEYSWTNSWDGSTNISTYDENWNMLESVTKDSDGNILWSDKYTYDEDGNFTGSEYFDGSTTYIYDANWNLLSAEADTSGMDVWYDTDGTTELGFKDTKSWGQDSSETTFYNSDGSIAGYESTWKNSWDNTTNVSKFDGDWNYISSETRDSDGNVLWSDKTLFNESGEVTGYEYFDGSTTFTYDENWNLVGTEVDTESLTKVLAEDGVTVIGYKNVESWGQGSSETTFFDLDGNITGYESSWTNNWDNSTNTSTYDENWNYLSSVTTDSTGNVLWSDTQLYNEDGSFAGSEYFDGVNTFVYDENWNLVSQTIDTSKLVLDEILEDNVLVGYQSTDQWGQVTLYNTDKELTGYKSEWTDRWNGHTHTDTHDANWNLLSHVETDKTGKVIWSEEYTYDADGYMETYTSFDGSTTTSYNSNWEITGTEVDTSGMEDWIGEDGSTVIGFKDTNEWGDTTYYNSDGSIAGYEYEFMNWDGTTMIDRYDANWNWIGQINLDKSGNVIWETEYEYNENGEFLGYTEFRDGVTKEFDENYQQVGDAVADTSKMDKVLDADGNETGDFKFENELGETTLVNADGVITGYEYEWEDMYNGHRHVDRNDADRNYLGHTEYDKDGNIVYQSDYQYAEDGAFLGYTEFDGVATREYDENWNYVGESVDTASLDPIYGTDGTTVVGYSSTNEWGDTTKYDVGGNVTGYEYEFENWDGNIMVDSYDANWMWLGNELRDKDTGEVISSRKELYNENNEYIGFEEYRDGVTQAFDEFGQPEGAAQVNFENLEKSESDDFYGEDVYRAEDQWNNTTVYDADGNIIGYEHHFENWDGKQGIDYFDADWMFVGKELYDGDTLVSSTKELYSTSGEYLGREETVNGVTTTYNADGTSSVAIGDTSGLDTYTVGDDTYFVSQNEWGDKVLIEEDNGVFETKYYLFEYQDFAFNTYVIELMDTDWMFVSRSEYEDADHTTLVRSETARYDDDGVLIGKTITNADGSTYDENLYGIAEGGVPYAVTADTTSGDNVLGTFTTQEGNLVTLIGDEATNTVEQVAIEYHFGGETEEDTYNLVFDTAGATSGEWTAYYAQTIPFGSDLDAADRPPKLSSARKVTLQTSTG